MAISAVRWEGTVRNRFAHRLGVQGDCPLFLLRAGRVRAPSVLLLPRAAGEVRSPASPPDVTCHRLGGDLRPLLRNVSGCAIIGAPVSALLHATSLREESNPLGGLLLLE
jgi:hypothetical protein